MTEDLNENNVMIFSSAPEIAYRLERNPINRRVIRENWLRVRILSAAREHLYRLQHIIHGPSSPELEASL